MRIKGFFFIDYIFFSSFWFIIEVICIFILLVVIEVMDLMRYFFRYSSIYNLRVVECFIIFIKVVCVNYIIDRVLIFKFIIVYGVRKGMGEGIVVWKKFF